jgi:hypothetical protein
MGGWPRNLETLWMRLPGDIKAEEPRVSPAGMLQSLHNLISDKMARHCLTRPPTWAVTAETQLNPTRGKLLQLQRRGAGLKKEYITPR